MSFHSDRVGKRKPILAIGYLVTAMMGLLGLVTAIWQIVVIRTVAWMGAGRAARCATRSFPKAYLRKRMAARLASAALSPPTLVFHARPSLG
jgi:hypothetical protein